RIVFRWAAQDGGTSILCGRHSARRSRCANGEGAPSFGPTWWDANSVRHKNAEAFFPLSPRGTSGERSGERGKLMKNGLLSPALSSFFRRRGRSHRASVRRAAEIRTRAACAPLFSSCPFVCIRGQLRRVEVIIRPNADAA